MYTCICYVFWLVGGGGGGTGVDFLARFSPYLGCLETSVSGGIGLLGPN